MGKSIDHDGSISISLSVSLSPDRSLLQAMHKILCHVCRDTAETLGNENDALRDQMRQTEKDTIDVISYMKKQDVDKDTEVDRVILSPPFLPPSVPKSTRHPQSSLS